MTPIDPMTLSDEQIATWREDAERLSASGERNALNARIIALVDALTDARLNGRIHRNDAHEFAKARDGWRRRAEAAEAKLARVQEVAQQLTDIPDYTPSQYDQGRVDQRHDDAEALWEALDGEGGGES